MPGAAEYARATAPGNGASALYSRAQTPIDINTFTDAPQGNGTLFA